MRSIRALLLAQGAEATSAALLLELALALCAPRPGAGELPRNASGADHLKEACAVVFAMLGEAPLQVLTGAEVVARVLVGTVEVQHVHGHAAPPVRSWSGTSCACSRRSRLQCCVTSPRSIAA